MPERDGSCFGISAMEEHREAAHSMKILFTGDSITDWGRWREDPNSMGMGYPLIVSAKLSVRHPGQFTFRNTGISGNRSVDVYARMKKDCWSLQPDLVSLLVGVNDVWQRLTEGDDLEVDRFERVYRMMIEDTVNRLPNAPLLLMGPFVLHGTAADEDWDWFSREVPLRAAAVQKIAEEFHTLYLPLQPIFDQACGICPADYWTMDGVHPTPAGHQLIADAWLELFDREILPNL